MKHTLWLVLLLCAVAAQAVELQAQAPAPEAPGAMNPLLDPFAVNAKPVLPLPPLPKGAGVPLPPMPPPMQALPPAALPPGLRALLIRDNGVGLLGAANLDAASITVVNGRSVRIGEQDYVAEVTAAEIRLYTPSKARLVWQGSLGGPAQVLAPVDLTQAHFTPPLSAGVSPGLRAGGGHGAAADALIRKNGAQ
jgi:hypothetical protein